MLRSMYSAISGMQAFQTKLDVIGNNIANVDTTGFKAGRTDFSSVLSQTMSGGSAPNGSFGGTNPQQVGLGVQVSAIPTLFTQGGSQSTGVQTDAMINGDGFFVVSNGNSNLLTREGDFTVDSNDNLVLPDGSIALGVHAGAALNSNGSNLEKINLQTLLSESNPTYTLANSPDVEIGADGSISVMATDPSGTSSRVTIGKLAIATVPNPDGLEAVGNTMFQVSNNSGSATYQVAGTNNTGTVQSGYLEMSNVDLTREFTEMIIAQRGFDANSHMIGTDNAILQDVVNLKNS